MDFGRKLTAEEKEQIKQINRQIDLICADPASLARGNSFYRFGDEARSEMEKLQLLQNAIYQNARTQ